MKKSIIVVLWICGCLSSVRGQSENILTNVAGVADLSMESNHLSNSFGFWINESQFAHIDYNSSGRIFFFIVDLGIQRFKKPIRWVAGAGFGAHIFRSARFGTNAEMTINNINENRFWQTRLSLLNQFRVVETYRINRHWSLFAGPVWNFLLSKVSNGSEILHGFPYIYDTKNLFVRGWFGLNLGTRFSR